MLVCNTLIDPSIACTWITDPIPILSPPTCQTLFLSIPVDEEYTLLRPTRIIEFPRAYELTLTVDKVIGAGACVCETSDCRSQSFRKRRAPMIGPMPILQANDINKSKRIRFRVYYPDLRPLATAHLMSPTHRRFNSATGTLRSFPYIYSDKLKYQDRSLLSSPPPQRNTRD